MMKWSKYHNLPYSQSYDIGLLKGAGSYEEGGSVVSIVKLIVEKYNFICLDHK